MKVAIAAAKKDLNSEINQTFGRAPLFAIYDTETKDVEFVENGAMGASGGAGIKSSQFLVDQKIEAVISFRLGENAVRVLTGAGITLYSAVYEKSLQENIDLLLNDKLESLVDIHSGYHHG
ncbi:MAG: NifB/NifX family molybdenum-iron cluster-binding protein [Pleomorphochaeta sp.]